MPVLSFAYRLDPRPEQVRYARRQVREILPGWGLAEYDDLVELIVSELVTNALPYSCAPVDVRLCYDREGLRIEVWDTGDEIPVRQDPGNHEERGRGLVLIDGLLELHGGRRGSTRHRTRPGKAVYVVLPLQPGQPSGQPSARQPARSPRRPCDLRTARLTGIQG